MEIEFENVSYTYNYKTPLRKVALRDIDLIFKTGKINCLLGKSGSGKTTLIELINALLEPTKGKITIDEFTLKKGVKIKNINDLRFNIGLIFQFPEEQIFCNTVYKEITFGMRYFNYKKDDLYNRAKQSLAMVGLGEEYLKRDPYTLSRGEMRKVAIASVLAYNPKVLIFDEPTVGLDDIAKTNFIKLLKTLKGKFNKTIILVTHDVDMVYEVADYIYVLQSGEVVIQGDKYKVFNHKLLNEYGIRTPKVLNFIHMAKKLKGIKLMQRDNINDLIKDVYRNVK